jgi:hypothetical protein
MKLFTRKKKEPPKEPVLVVTVEDNHDVTLKYKEGMTDEAGKALMNLVIALSYQVLQGNEISIDEYTQILNDSLTALVENISGGTQNDTME